MWNKLKREDPVIQTIHWQSSKGQPQACFCYKTRQAAADKEGRDVQETRAPPALLTGTGAKDRELSIIEGQNL